MLTDANADRCAEARFTVQLNSGDGPPTIQETLTMESKVKKATAKLPKSLTAPSDDKLGALFNRPDIIYRDASSFPIGLSAGDPYRFYGTEGTARPKSDGDEIVRSARAGACPERASSPPT